MKKISDAEVRETFRQKSKRRHEQEEAVKLLDSDLFSVNVDKTGLQNKRDKLAKDRFKNKKEDGLLKSKTDQAIIKKL